jgi:hypothetical protein
MDVELFQPRGSSVHKKRVNSCLVQYKKRYCSELNRSIHTENKFYLIRTGF